MYRKSMIKNGLHMALPTLAAAFAVGPAHAAGPAFKHTGGIATITFAAADAALKPAAAGGVDFVNAKTKEMPVASAFSADIAQADLIAQLSSVGRSGHAGILEGADGDGQSTPLFLGKPAHEEGGVAPQEAGTSNQPFSTARADGATGSTNKIYPFRAAGKLFFTDNGASFICSASLIKPGIVVTAAHCVNKYGENRSYTNFSFIPGYKSGAAPYGAWTVKQVSVLSAYAKGTDTCSQAGVVCKDDVALLVLNAQNGRFAGTSTGYYSVGYNGYGFTSTNLIHITQLGYPACLDNGEIMERNDSHGFKSASNTNNTLIGSLMCGGSSGGPWMTTFGVRPNLTSTTTGTNATPNTVVGVTSWGSTSTGPKQMGASPFLDTNVIALLNGVCANFPANCN